MSIELDADELALHDYQPEHFSEILSFIFWQILGYGTLLGTLLALFFYLWTYRDIRQPNGLLTWIYIPPPSLPEVVLNCFVRIPIGAILGCTIAAGIGFIHAKLLQMKCRKVIKKAYVEEFDLKLLFMLYQIVIPIPVIAFILIIETPVLWYADTSRGIWFIAISYIAVCVLLSVVRYRFLKWYIPPLLPELQ